MCHRAERPRKDGLQPYGLQCQPSHVIQRVRTPAGHVDCQEPWERKGPDDTDLLIGQHLKVHNVSLSGMA